MARLTFHLKYRINIPYRRIPNPLFCFIHSDRSPETSLILFSSLLLGTLPSLTSLTKLPENTQALQKVIPPNDQSVTISSKSPTLNGKTQILIVIYLLITQNTLSSVGHDHNMISTLKGNQWHAELLCMLDSSIDMAKINKYTTHFFGPRQNKSTKWERKKRDKEKSKLKYADGTQTDTYIHEFCLAWVLR